MLAASGHSPFGVDSLRGAIVESVHPASVAVVDANGRLVAHAGDPDFVTVLRSAAKPFQALPVVEDGARDHFGITPPELAIICGSHNGEPEQVALVRGLLERIGCAESDLVCGPHRSLVEELGLGEEAQGGVVVPAPRTPLGSNCSGKHTGMLALARHHGWPTRDYQRSDHPVQQRCKRALADWTGVPPDAIAEAVDGCGVVCFALPLRALALGYARLATRKDAAAAVVDAMCARPDLVAGRRRLCTALMQAVPQVLAKVGAEGVYGAALLDRGWGVAIKMEDGNTRAAGVALLAVLDQLGITPLATTALPRYAQLPITNTRGEIVGSLRARGALSFV
jgi:L-asparaginase II